jgi:glucose-1-phosphate cytidylyltransferase
LKVVILCGGFGSRIRDVSEDIPKPMIRVGSYPIIWHIMKYYSTFGFNDFILCTGYKSQVIKDFFLGYEAHTKDFTISLGSGDIKYHTNHNESDWSVTLADTGMNAMTGSRIRKIKKYIGNDENFMLTYGDGLGDIDIDELINSHISSKKILTVTGARPPGRFGEIMADKNNLVAEFNEKPQSADGRISAGYFVCRREIFDYLDDREDLVFEQDPINKLVLDRQLSLYKHQGFWQPMDTNRDYKLLNNLMENANPPWVKW